MIAPLLTIAALLSVPFVLRYAWRPERESHLRALARVHEQVTQ